MDLQYLFDRAIDIVFTRRFRMKDLDGKGASGNCKDGGVPIKVGELRIMSSQHHPRTVSIMDLTFSAFIVAEVTMSLRSRRLVKTGFGILLALSICNFVPRTFPQETHENICTQRSFVGLVQDNDAVSVKIPLIQRLAQQNTVGHV
jgi:hypothetical protein